MRAKRSNDRKTKTPESFLFYHSQINVAHWKRLCCPLRSYTRSGDVFCDCVGQGRIAKSPGDYFAFFPDTYFSDSHDTLAAIPFYFPDMPTTKYYTGPEVAAMLAAPAVLSHPAEGDVQVEKSGVIGFGLTVRDAMEDWGRKFSGMIELPKTT
jgi:hypothetical protein